MIRRIHGTGATFLCLATLALTALVAGSSRASSINVTSLNREVSVFIGSNWIDPSTLVDISENEPDPTAVFNASLSEGASVDLDGQVFSIMLSASQVSQIHENTIDVSVATERPYCSGPCASIFGTSFASSTFELVFELGSPSILDFSAAAVGFDESDGAPRPFFLSSDGAMDLTGTRTGEGGVVWDISGHTSAIQGFTYNDYSSVWEISGTVPAGVYHLWAESLYLTQDVHGGSLDLSMSVAPIPEPSSAMLFGIGSLIVGAATRRKLFSLH